MKIKSFIQKSNSLAPTLEELKNLGLPTSLRGRWTIEVLNQSFDAYDFPIAQMIYCCDTITLFESITFYDDIDEYKEKYYFFGENPNSEFIYAMDSHTEEIVLLDNTDYSIYQMIASDGYVLLDALVEAATLFRKDILDGGNITEADRMTVAMECARLAGIPSKPQFWIEFVGAYT
jgi:hypothetical protein